MSAKITTRPGYAIPPAPRHSVTFQLGTWELAEKFGSNPMAMIPTLNNAYPRMRPHQDITKLTTQILKRIAMEDKACLLFGALESARECVEYSTSPKRANGADKSPVPAGDIEIRLFNLKDRFYAVIFPREKIPIVYPFWINPGCGISSRMAEANLSYIDQLREGELGRQHSGNALKNQDFTILRTRIVNLLQRAVRNPDNRLWPTADDIYFYPSGAASIYKTHTYLTKHYDGTSVLFGMAFTSTVIALEEIGNDTKFFGLGNAEDILRLEAFAAAEDKAGRKIQAIWAEFPTNPLLVSPDLFKLREIADKYDIAIIVDDTIGSWANIDLLEVVDILVTSITKSFNGYADVIAGSAILNPASRKYLELKTVFQQYYEPELYADDAAAIELNSRDYLERTQLLNTNANALVQYLSTCAANPDDAVRSVHYPSINASGVHYKRFMRQDSLEFKPGYGCLFNIELEDIPTAIAFYDNLNVHSGPHLGAPFTIALPYTLCIYKNKLDWAAKYGLKPNQIRISVGLEDTQTLLEDFRIAVEAANEVKSAKVTKTEY